jgi:hypothetical protein
MSGCCKLLEGGQNQVALKSFLKSKATLRAMLKGLQKEGSKELLSEVNRRIATCAAASKFRFQMRAPRLDFLLADIVEPGPDTGDWAKIGKKVTEFFVICHVIRL